MRTWKWMITASLLMGLSAMAQQTMTPASPSPAPAQPATQADPPSAAPSSSPQSANITATPAPSVSASPVTTMDQVVDRAIEREHALIAMLKTRTPLVETYLQNLKLDEQMGPSPIPDNGSIRKEVNFPILISCVH